VTIVTRVRPLGIVVAGARGKTRGRIALVWAFLLAAAPAAADPLKGGPAERPAAARRSAPAPAGEPALCRDAIAARPGDPVAALREAESARWRTAREAHARARRGLHRALGDVAGARLQREAAAFGAVSAAHHQAMREARALCGCRARRGDPDGARCDRLYPRGGLWPDPPARTTPHSGTPAEDQESRSSQETRTDAATEESGS
jgi:hypothetical protein